MHDKLHPSSWKAAKGYANGILSDGGRLYVGGQIGWTSDQVFKSHDFVGQMEQALKNVSAVVTAAGGRVEDIVRLTWYVTDKRDYLARQREVGEAYRRVMGRHFPAMTLVQVAALVEDRARVEIESTAVVPEP